MLLFYGEEDEWTPVDESIAAWQRAAATAGNGEVMVVRLPGTSHHPTLRQRQDIEAISPLYSETLVRWLTQRLSPAS